MIGDFTIEVIKIPKPELPASSSHDWRDIAECRDADPEIKVVKLREPETQIATHDWRDKAACAQPGIDPEIFFNAEKREDALRICDFCPSIDDCAAFAQRLDSDGLPIGAYGVWGGTTQEYRHEIRRRKRRAADDPSYRLCHHSFGICSVRHLCSLRGIAGYTKARKTY